MIEVWYLYSGVFASLMPFAPLFSRILCTKTYIHIHLSPLKQNVSLSGCKENLAIFYPVNRSHSGIQISYQDRSHPLHSLCLQSCTWYQTFVSLSGCTLDTSLIASGMIFKARPNWSDSWKTISILALFTIAFVPFLYLIQAIFGVKRLS